MTIRKLTPMTDAELLRAGRVWESATHTDRAAIVHHAYGYPCEMVTQFPWHEVGHENQKAIARTLATLTEVLRRGTLRATPGMVDESSNQAAGESGTAEAGAATAGAEHGG